MFYHQDERDAAASIGAVGCFLIAVAVFVLAVIATVST